MPCSRIVASGLLACALGAINASGQTYTIDFHAISAGGNAARNSCFGVSATVAQIAPGGSNTNDGTPPTYAVYAGFWSAAPATGLDEIFFTGFEEC